MSEQKSWKIFNFQAKNIRPPKIVHKWKTGLKRFFVEKEVRAGLGNQDELYPILTNLYIF